MFSATGGVEVPRSEDAFADTEVAEIRVIALESSLSGFVLSRTDADSAVAFSRESVAELKLKICQLLVFEDKVASAHVTIADNHSILDRPRFCRLGGHGRPAIQALAIED